MKKILLELITIKLPQLNFQPGKNKTSVNSQATLVKKHTNTHKAQFSASI
jgi:hypothetical protein